jgi:two-component system sensor histidine kinase VicK
MKIHFFSRTDINNRSAFRVYHTLQNLNAIKKVSVVCFIICLSVRIIFFFPGISTETMTHMSVYNNTNWASLIIAPLFYAASVLLINRFKPKPDFLRFAQLLSGLFALFIIIISIRASFFSMYNPRNTLLMYFVGVITIGIFFTFEFYETIAIILLAGIYFSLLIPFYQDTNDELLLNNIASLILLTVFFCISRFMFSYRADNFMKIKAIEQKNIEIENASQMKNEILGIVAHDLRNPLTAIKFVTSLMEIDEKMDAENSEYLQLIRTSCDKASAIINDLLEMAHNDLTSELEMEEVELNQFLAQIIDEWLKNKNQEINIKYNQTQQPVYTSINRQKMQRVMDNLISNAIKFSGDVDYIEISLKELDNAVYIDVKDYGIGIPENLLPYIFDRFSKASRKGNRGEMSVGLGLSIVNQIIQKHSGEIRVDSAEQRGTTFTIKLPLSAA